MPESFVQRVRYAVFELKSTCAHTDERGLEFIESFSSHEEALAYIKKEQEDHCRRKTATRVLWFFILEEHSFAPE